MRHQHIIDEAAEFTRRRIQHITRATILDYHEREETKQRAWDHLNAGDITAIHVANILTAWAHREISHFGVRGKPGLETLKEWAGQIFETLDRTRELRKGYTNAS